jgi:ATP-dependent RNA helicase DDX42
MERSQNNSMIDPIWRFEELLKASSSYDSDTQPKSSITALVEYLQTQFPNPTLVQSQTWSVALSGKDALITAATGQGKTFAYVVPMSLHCLWNQHRQHSDYDDDEGGLSDKIDVGPRGLVLVPTRELALQISKHAQPLLTVLSSSSSRYPLKCKAIIGGQGKYLLRQELKKNRGKLDFVIATPGRLLDVVSENRKKHGLSLQNVTFVVLDEADKMLHMGFEPQVRKILQSLRTDRQTLMLSATLGRKVEGLASEWLNPSAIRIAVGRTGEASEHVHQHVMVLPDPAAKAAFLIEMLPVFISVGRTLVFVKTREGCEQLAETITRETQPTIPILTLHGDKHQIDRNAAVRKFTGGEVQVIVATDVAARGLDIPHVQTVVCYDPAKDLDSHTHRVGRTGRLSANQSDGGTENQTSGSAYTLLTKNDADFAFVLRNAFQREGREVDTQLEALANSSRRAGNGTAIVCDNHKNKTGLGFVPFSTFRDDSTTSLSSPPPKRHRRWGPAR